MAQVTPQGEAVDDAAPAAAIVVTGSRIKNPNLENTSPVAALSEDELGFSRQSPPKNRFVRSRVAEHRFQR